MRAGGRDLSVTEMGLVLFRKRHRRRVPKEFLAPRPMVDAPELRVRVWQRLPIELFAAVFCVSLLVFSPLRDLDDWVTGTLLAWQAPSDVSTSTVLVTLSADDVRHPDCGQRILRLLTRGGAQGVLTLHPTGKLCPALLQQQSSEGALTPPVAALPRNFFRWSGEGRVLGFEVAQTPPVADALGVNAQYWVASRAALGVPQLRFSEFSYASVNASEVAGKIVVLGLAPEVASRSPGTLAGAIAAALDDPPQSVPRLWLQMSSLLLGGFVVWLLLRHRQRSKVASVLVRIFAVVGYPLFCVVAVFSFGALFPGLTGTVGVLGCYGILRLPETLHSRRAARRVLENATQQVSVAVQGPETDGTFWRRVAERAAKAHSADDVLIAELPAHQWRLKVWPHGDVDETLIRERRRDIRRTPFANQEGVPTASVAHGFLVMKGVPTVLVPFLCNGDVEGYAFYIGKSAEREFNRDSNKAKRVGEELGSLIRQRRLDRMQEELWKKQGLMGVSSSPHRVSSALMNARAATNELRLLQGLLQSSPVGVLYADSFGDVRLMSPAFQDWIRRFGVKIPSLGPNGSLATGQLGLVPVLASVASHSGKTVPELNEILVGTFELTVHDPFPDDARSYHLMVRAVDNGRDFKGGQGFVATVAHVVRRESQMPRISRIPVADDPLAVTSLAKLLKGVTAMAAARTGGNVRLQAPRDAGYIIAHKRRLRVALESFLVEASARGGKTGVPVVALTEGAAWVELQILDLKLGAPTGALRRALLAPGEPPAGLDALAEFVLAVENSHGTVRLDTDDSWGVELVARLLRARPQVEDDTSSVLSLKELSRGLKV